MKLRCLQCGHAVTLEPGLLEGEKITSVLCPMCDSLIKLESARPLEEEIELRYPRRRILVAEDSRAFTMMLKDLLEEAGYEVCAASDGDEALDAFCAARPDLVLLDLKLPKRDGFAVLDALRGMAEGAKVPVLVMSGAHNPVEAIHRLRELGASGFINKEAVFDTVLDRVHALVAEEESA